MFKILCLCVVSLVGASLAASIGSDLSTTTEKREIIPLLKFESNRNPDGSFDFTYEGGDKSFREETAHVVDAGTEDEALEVSGSYRYIDEDGQVVEVHYTAGKNGFVPVGTNILPEISSLAKAAADLPAQDEEELASKRQARSEKHIQVAVVNEEPADEKEINAKEQPAQKDVQITAETLKAF